MEALCDYRFFSPSELSSEQCPLYDDMRKGIEANFKGFVVIKGAGQLFGPWNPWISVSEIRCAGLGPSQIPIHGTDLAEARPRNRDPRHGCTFPFRLRDICACSGRRTARDYGRQDCDD